MRHCIIVFWVCVALCRGQELSPTAWNILVSVDQGHKVRVETSTKKYTGTFVEASEEAITLNMEDRQLSISRTDVLRVYSQSRSNRIRNTLIGAAIGAAVGITAYATLGTLLRNEGADDTVPRLLMPPIGIGAGVGAIIPTGSMRKIYDVKEDVSRR